ncbi:emp24/gp25L/p24 family/GOLD-domain-containing protein [Paraphysoderma sedebokerense]|nr:emp24/gp25L/p24 family/GOLD-domain-containing protein [Paraphysoderma sedebokerense]
MRPSLVLLLCVALAVLSLANAFTITLEPHEQQCFYENLVKDQHISIGFQVAEGGQLDIDFWVSDPKNRLVHVVSRETTGNFEVKPDEDGKYSYCFSNKMSSMTAKVVQFTLYGVDHKPAAADPSEKIDPIQQAVNELAEGIHGIKDEQQYLISRERVHRHTVESSNTRSLWWSVFQLFIIVVVMLVQVYFLKQYFEVKRVV